MMQCRSEVKRDAVRRENIDGIDYIIVSSATLPFDIVMNGVLYSKDEILRTYKTLEGTPAPIEHPHVNDDYVSATSQEASSFDVGVINKNVRIEGERVLVDKYIDVNEASKTDKGKRLIDRAIELETNANARPIHTSVGVWLEIRHTPDIKTNALGQEYASEAIIDWFDHDAILLDSVGAAQPHQGVGMAVNKEGNKIVVDTFSLPTSKNKYTEDQARKLFSCQSSMSFDEIRNALRLSFEKSGIGFEWIEELFIDKVIFWSNDSLFQVSFSIDEEDKITILGVPLAVERNVTYQPVTNQNEGDAMKDLILNALKKAEVKTEGLSDSELFAEFQKLNVNKEKEPEEKPKELDIAGIVANAVTEANKPLVDELSVVKSQLKANETAEIDGLSTIIVNSGKYAGLTADSLKLLPFDELKAMAANCGSAHGISPIINSKVDDEFAVNKEMQD